MERRTRSGTRSHSCTVRRRGSYNDVIRVMTKITPRGIRNNNPLNIRIGNTWLGERQNPTDPAFEEFVSIEYGLRAAFCILRRYIRRYHKQTVPEIVSTWAPSSENNTQRYIDIVCQRSGIKPDQHIQYEDAVTMCKLVEAMAFVECGQPIDGKKIEKGYTMA